MTSFKAHLLVRISQLLSFAALTAADTLTVTITDYPGYLTQRNCAFSGPGCFVNGAPTNFNSFGCPTNPLENACYCRADVLSVNVKAISSCVNKECSGNSVDVQSATSIYLAYCSANGYVEAVQTASSAAQQSSITSVVVPGTGTTAGGGVQSRPSSTTSSAQTTPSSSESGPLSLGTIIGIAVSVACSLLGLIIGVGFKVLKYRKEQKKKAQQQAQEQRNGVFNQSMRPYPWMAGRCVNGDNNYSETG